MVATYGRLMDALFLVVTERPTAQQYQDVLLSLGSIEAIMRHGTGFAVQSVPRLRPEWVAASYDGTAEFRLALAFALPSTGISQRPWNPGRSDPASLAPLDRKQPWRFATTGTGTGAALDLQPDVVMHGRRGIDDAIALVERRLVEASQGEGRHLPLKAAPRASAGIADLTALVPAASISTAR